MFCSESCFHISYLDISNIHELFHVLFKHKFHDQECSHFPLTIPSPVSSDIDLGGQSEEVMSGLLLVHQEQVKGAASVVPVVQVRQEYCLLTEFIFRRHSLQIYLPAVAPTMHFPQVCGWAASGLTAISPEVYSSVSE